MLDKFRVRNFRCLRDVEVPLGPLTFLIGPNNTGKSSFLDAVAMLSHCTRVRDIATLSALAGGRFGRTVTGGDAKLKIKLDAGISWHDEDDRDRHGRYCLGISQGAQYPVVSHELFAPAAMDGHVAATLERERHEPGVFSHRGFGAPLVEALVSKNGTILWHLAQKMEPSASGVEQAMRCTPKYKLIPQRMAEPCQVEPSTELSGDGYGLASCLDTLREVTPDRFREIERALKQFVSTIDAVTFPTVGPGKKSVLFHEKPTGSKVYASEASDGLLLFLAYLTIAYSHGDASVLLVEEPEQGVHSHRLKAIVELLRAISRGSLGTRPVQVIATSHSPYLLDCCEKDEIAIFARDEKGGVTVTPMADVPNIDEQLDDFAPGELIHTFGRRICGSHS